MNHSYGYVLNQRPFRDSSYLIDLFTEDYGRICCVARPAKKRGKIVKGNLEPFRFLHFQWLGKGDVQTLTEADERGRHVIPASEMMLGLYLNELLLLLTRQHVAFPELFSAYKYTLHKLGDPSVNRQIVMRFELYLLDVLGYPVIPPEDADISFNRHYRFTLEGGLIALTEAISADREAPDSLSQNTCIRGDVLSALQDIQQMKAKHWKQLRTFLDGVFTELAPRKINARQLLNF